MINWFGEYWGAPINECPRCETPVGEQCTRCARPILDGDKGVTMPAMLADGDTGVAAFHLACFTKSTLDHKYWPQLGLVPDQGDGFVHEGREDELLDVVRCPTCGMRYSYREQRWL
jgi:hypothetical protein